MSRAITVTVLSGLVLTACLTTGGCRRPRAADRTWHDPAGNPVPEHWVIDPSGKRVPDPHPHDRYGRAWVYDADGNLVPPPPGSSHSSTWFWGGSGYRSGGPTTSYRSGSPSVSSPSVSRGGFGSTGASLGGGT